jgi:hypothetical protein
MPDPPISSAYGNGLLSSAWLPNDLSVFEDGLAAQERVDRDPLHGFVAVGRPTALAENIGVRDCPARGKVHEHDVRIRSGSYCTFRRIEAEDLSWFRGRHLNRASQGDTPGIHLREEEGKVELC